MTMTSASIQSLPTPTRPRWFQFSLLTLLTAVTVLGAVLGIWFYYRPFVASVDARFAIVDGAAAKAIALEHAPHLVSDSPYAWVALTEEELPRLLQLEGRPAPILGTTMRHTIPYWPNTAFGGLYHNSRWIPAREEAHLGTIQLPVDESGALTGMIGSRIAGGQAQLRVECNVTCKHGDAQAVAGGRIGAHKELKGHLVYEGQTPNGHLVFLAPVDDDVYSVVIFDVQ